MPLERGGSSAAVSHGRWRTLEVGAAGVEIFEVGEGDPVLFLPGWGLSARAYAAALLPLATSGLRVIAPSLPGFGASTPLDLGAPLERYAERIVDVLDVLDPERPVFIAGHSFGGGVALKVAQLRPDLIRSLTAVNPVGGAPDRHGLRRASWLGWSLANAVGALPRSRPHRVDPSQAALVALDLVPSLSRHPLRSAASGAVALTAQLAEEAVEVAESGLPTLYIWGDRDRLVLPGRLDGLGGPKSTEIIAGGHGWVITHPREFSVTLHAALAVHALLEREIRGESAVTVEAVAAAAGDTTAPLAGLFPPERRRRARHKPPSRPPLATADHRPMGWR